VPELHFLGEVETQGKVLVSACLLGEAVRYDGRAKTVDHPVLARWMKEGRLVSFCPEMAGGLGVPRPRCEIVDGTGEDVWQGRARVMDEHGGDCTEAFRAGAQAALELCQREGVTLALLKENSPSCGSHRVADGTFSATRRPGSGVTVALLRGHGITVISEEELA
jgi:uncharacterized protein YbbK (DUF523 family)